MLRALTSGVAGLKSHQTKMDVIGNNIANVNTYGFKSSRATFKDSFYQTISGSSDSTEARGGANPIQVGYGSVIGSIDVLHTRGSYTSTGEAMDVFISGEGYLIAQDGNGKERYTRVGVMNFDGNGNLVDGNQFYIAGYPISRYSEPGVGLNIGGIDVNFGTKNAKLFEGYNIEVVADAGATTPTATVEPAGSKNIQIKAAGPITALQLQTALRGLTGGPTGTDLNAISVTGDSATTNMASGTKSHAAQFHDVGDVVFKTTSPQPATLTAKDGAIQFDFGAANGSFFNGYRIEIEPAGAGATGHSASIDPSKKTLQVQAVDGKITAAELQEALQKIQKPVTGEVPDNISFAAITVKDATNPPLELGTMTTNKAANGKNMVQSTVLDKTHGVQHISLPGTLSDSNQDGTYDTEESDIIRLVGIQIGSDGIISGEDGNGNIIQVGQIVLANVPNPQALTMVGDSYYSAENNTGIMGYSAPGSGGVGTLVSGGLEGSNVDLANEFADMITTQRGFQANSRIITVGDEMLQELINLKR